MVVMIRFLRKMKNELLLLSGADIPFISGTLTIHQPTIKEISLIGEECLFSGCELLKFSKDMLSIEDKSHLENYSDFNILMSIINDNNVSMQQHVSQMYLVLSLLFPYYEILTTHEALYFMQPGTDNVQGSINNDNFEEFKKIINQMFCLTKASEEYDPQGALAKKIADKFKQRKKQLAELQSKPNKVAIFSRYISILAVGEHKDMNSLMQYTVYQLFDEFQRYQLKVGYDTFLKARLAGASDLKEPEDWMKDIHE